MSQIIKIAEEITCQLSMHNAKMQFSPEFDLRELEERKVIVVPCAIEYKALTRNTYEELPAVQIGILQRATEDDLPELLSFTQSLAVGFLYKKIAGALCVSISYDPIYSPEHLQERGQFVGVIELLFKAAKKKDEQTTN